ncbi:MAG: transporter substrate-binding domain-containing protein [Kiritimatiellae bacterium]|nr:transporter substrate-binding domain-containing protein [Kiritimatiellia bacterium]
MSVRFFHLLFTRCFILVGLGMLLGLSGCALGPTSQELNIGFLPANPPFTYPAAESFEAQSAWAGLEPELARRLAAELGMEPKFVPLEGPADLLPALRSGKVDILMTGLPVRDDWRSSVEFSPPYLVTGLAVIHLAGTPLLARDPLVFSTPARLRSSPLRMAIPNTSPAAGAFVAAHLPLARCQYVPDVPAAIAAVLERRAEVALAPAPALWFHLHGFAPEAAAQIVFAPYLLAPHEVAWACRPGSSELRNAFQTLVPRWAADGTLNQVLSTYLPTQSRHAPTLP